MPDALTLEEMRSLTQQKLLTPVDPTSLDGRAGNSRGSDAPQPLYHRLLLEQPIIVSSSGVDLLRMADCISFMREKAVQTRANGLLMGSPRPLIPLDLNGDEHTKFRRLLDPIFAARSISYLEPTIREQANHLIDAFIDDGEVELHDRLCVPLPTTIFISMMGLPAEELPIWLAYKDGAMHAPGNTPEERFAHNQATGSRMYEHLSAVLEERRRREAPSKDLIGRLMTAEVDGTPLTEETIVDILYVLMIAGLDTVTASLSLMFHRLATHPDEREWVARSPEIIPNVVEELMRYETPVTGSGRITTDEVIVAGVAIPPRTFVGTSYTAANLDPAAFSDPLKVNYERADYRHASFALGPHRCLGSHLARLEMRCALEEFHRRIPRYGVAVGETPVIDTEAVRRCSYLPLAF